MHNPTTTLRAWKNNPKRLRVRGSERILFAKRLSLYLRAGVPILEALDLIRLSANSKNNTNLLQKVIYDVQNGNSLSRALSKFPRAYSSEMLQFVVVGETSGTLPIALSFLAQALEIHAARTRSIISALTYPAILLFGSLGISIFLLVYAFPKLIPLFRGLHARLPFTTRVILGLSNFLQSHWIFLGCMTTAAAIILYTILLRIPAIRFRIQKCVLSIPFFGRVLRIGTLAALFRTLSMLLSSGVRLDEALRIVQNGSSQAMYRSSFVRLQQEVLSGNKLSVAMSAESFLFPPVAVQLVSLGEMTGTLSESTGSLADIFDEDLTDCLRVLSTVLEPGIMVVMGFVIGFIALAIISPMYGITQDLAV